MSKYSKMPHKAPEPSDAAVAHAINAFLKAHPEIGEVTNRAWLEKAAVDAMLDAGSMISPDITPYLHKDSDGQFKQTPEGRKKQKNFQKTRRAFKPRRDL